MRAHAHILFALCLGLAPAMAGATSPRLVIDPSLPRALEGPGSVQVAWNDPTEFSEIRLSGNRSEAARGTWVIDLASHLAERANAHLADGQTLSLTLTDIDLAGDYEPWHGPQMRDVRMLRDIYPPRIRLDFTLRDASGQVIAEGNRELRDLGYLHGLRIPTNNNDSLRYEKKLIDRWLVQEFGPGQHLSASK